MSALQRELSQQEIDAVFHGTNAPLDEQEQAAAFDFSRLDRIPKSQLRAINLLHENFVRNLASNLSAYLRSYVSLNLVSLEQISYSEFLEGISTPTCLAYVGLHPYDTTAVFEINTNLIFGLIELLLGGSTTSQVKIQRKITEIEKQLVQTLMRVVLRDLNEAWKSVADIAFAVQSLASEPQLLHVLAPAEAVVVIAIEVSVAGTAGLMNLAIPSIFIKRLRHKFDHLRQVRRAESNVQNQLHVAWLIQNTGLDFEARLDGGRISTQDLLALQVGDVLMLDHALGREVCGLLNDRPQYTGWIVAGEEGKMSFEISDLVREQNEIDTESAA